MQVLLEKSADFICKILTWFMKEKNLEENDILDVQIVISYARHHNLIELQQICLELYKQTWSELMQKKTSVVFVLAVELGLFTKIEMNYDESVAFLCLGWQMKSNSANHACTQLINSFDETKLENFCEFFIDAMKSNTNSNKEIKDILEMMVGSLSILLDGKHRKVFKKVVFEVLPDLSIFFGPAIEIVESICYKRVNILLIFQEITVISNAN